MAFYFSALVLLNALYSSSASIETFLTAFRGNRQLLDQLTQLVTSHYRGRTDVPPIFAELYGTQSDRNFMKLNWKYECVLFDGDIVISEERLCKMVEAVSTKYSPAHQRIKRWAYRDLFYPSTIWRRGVPYEFDSDLPPEAIGSLERAMGFWQNNTCVTFRPRTNESQYLFYTGSEDMCSSTVGRDTTQPKQPVYIGPQCYDFGITTHEIAHALGLFHHQQRYDRDEYVTFYPDSIDRSDANNFAEIPPNFLSTYGLPYDVGSVMHYSPTEYTRNSSFAALAAKDENLQGTMGQMDGPSFLDVEIINLHYNCLEKCKGIKLKKACLNGGYQNPLNCSVCKCPTAFGGDFCQLIASSSPLNCGGLIPASHEVTTLKMRINNKENERRQCIYHIRAQANQRVLVKIVSISGKCEEGCYSRAVELKMTNDSRPVGYRFCCQSQMPRLILSKGCNVPVIFFAQNGTLNVTMYFRSVNADSNTLLNSTTLFPNYSASLAKVYEQKDSDYGVDLQLLQSCGSNTTHRCTENTIKGGETNDCGAANANRTLLYGSNGESCDDLSNCGRSN